MKYFKKLIAATLLILAAAAYSYPQTYEKLADETFKYVKYSTFGKPKVVKNTNRLALVQLRIHYKVITTKMIEERDKSNSARVSVYLDGDLTNQDLQNLTNEFYTILQNKLSRLGIEFVDWEAIKNTEYYSNRVQAAAENKSIDGDLENGQAWVSFTAFNGPVFYRFNPVNPLKNESIAFGKTKKMSDMSEKLGAELAAFDIVIDFTSINLTTDFDTVWDETGKYNEYKANQTVVAILNSPTSNILLHDRKNNWDVYQGKKSIAISGNFANRLYEDPSRAALKVKQYFGDGGNTRFAFNPVVVEVDRLLYLRAARILLNQYADLLVTKMQLLRAGENSKSVASKTPSDNYNSSSSSQPNANLPKDTTVEKVKEEARKNNQTTAVTYGENMAEAEQAEANQQWNLAVGYYTEAIKIRPDSADPYFKRGIIYVNYLKNYKAAVADFTKSYELNPSNMLALYNRAAANLQLYEFKKTIKDLDTFIASNPDMAEAFLNRGIALMNLNKDLVDRAIEDFNKGMLLKPAMPNLYRARAAAYQLKGLKELARADELRAAQLERGQ